jgi:uncharacterized protein (UPF0147 family)
VANIFQQYLAPPKSVLDYSAELDQADARKQAFQQNALALAAGQQIFDEQQQATQRAAQLRTALLGLPQGATDDQRIAAMRGTGTPEGFAAADALSKSLVEQRKGAAAASKDEADAAQTNLKRDIALHDFHAQKLATVQTPEDALAWAQEGKALGLFNQPGQYERGVAMIQKASQSPEAFAQWKAAAMQGGQSITEQMKQQLEQVKQDEAVRHNKSTEALTAAGQAQQERASLRADARAREQAEVSRGQVVQSDNGPVLVNTRTGTGTQVTVDGKAVPAKGSGQQAKDAQSVISLLDMAEPLLDTATHSLVGEGYDRAAAAFGKSTEGAQAAAQLRALEGALISKQPKMSGPQSDKDVLLYRQMAGQIGDPSVPIETRRAAMKTVRALNEKYAGQQNTAVPGASDAQPVRKYNPATGRIE